MFGNKTHDTSTSPEALKDDIGSIARSPEVVDVSEAIAVIDTALATLLKRELVSTAEVADLLLDVRQLVSPTTK